jgi:hypothetical protein
MRNGTPWPIWACRRHTVFARYAFSCVPPEKFFNNTCYAANHNSVGDIEHPIVIILVSQVASRILSAIS